MELLAIILLSLIVGGQAFLLYKQSTKFADTITKAKEEKTVITMPFENADAMAKDPERISIDEVSDEDFMKAMRRTINPSEEVDSEAKKAEEEVFN